MLIRKGQLSAPEAIKRIGGHKVDFWRRERLVVEVDGFAFHSSASRFEADRRRDADLSATGFRVIRVTWRQLTREPEMVLVRLAQTLIRSA
jgi:very-short-patch-repair endonuclease